MKNKKYIEEKYSESKSLKNKTLIAYVVNVPLPNGKKFYQRFKITDYKDKSFALKDAMKVRDETLSLLDLAKEKKYSFDSYTVEELFQMIPSIFPRTIRTYEKYKSYYDVYIKKDYGNREIRTIEREDISNTLSLCAEKCCQETVSDLKSLWKKIFAIGIIKQSIQINLADLVESPKSVVFTKRRLSEQNITQEDFIKFIEALSSYGNYSISEKDKLYFRQIVSYMLQIQRITGLRSQEIRALRKDCLSIENGTGVIHVKKSIGSTGKETNVEVATKTPYSIRSIYGVDANLINEIISFSKHDLIFADYYGKPISSDKYSDFLNRVSKSCGIKVYSTLLRKSLASDLYAAGQNAVIIKKIFGHKDETMSLNAYATISAEATKNAIQSRVYKQ